jgi:ubiquinone/menaquinone biosynthesis C-methylase UbiE
MNLNLGSGYKQIDGYMNVDNNALCKPDYLVDISNEVWPFEDNTIDDVMLYHVLEHIGDGFFHLMQELYRVCKPNSVVDIRVPHPRHDNFIIDPTHIRPIMPGTLAMFSKKHIQADMDNDGRETPIAFMYDVDFELTYLNYTLTTKYDKLFQTLTNDECQHIVDSSYNVIEEILMKLKVIK